MGAAAKSCLRVHSTPCCQLSSTIMQGNKLHHDNSMVPICPAWRWVFAGPLGCTIVFCSQTSVFPCFKPMVLGGNNNALSSLSEHSWSLLYHHPSHVLSRSPPAESPTATLPRASVFPANRSLLCAHPQPLCLYATPYSFPQPP
jgi:hypothetical protein